MGKLRAEGSGLADPDDISKLIDKDTRQNIIDYIENNKPDKGSLNNSSNKVSKNMCNLINEMYEKDTPVSDIVDILPIKTESAVYYHIRGDCSHESRSKVTYDECGWMRVHAKNGAPSKTLAVLYDLSQKSVTRHLTGECNHEDGIKPLTPEDVRDNTYTEASNVTSVCPVCGNEFEHKEYRSRTTCSSECNVKYASEAAKEVVPADD